MPPRSVEELRCPTCGARQGWADTCRRCKSDLRLLRAALEAYEDHRRAGLAALEAGRLEAAQQHARRCHELRPGPESHRLMAVCQLLRGDWPGALAEARF
jgi:ribosomal protein L40E